MTCARSLIPFAAGQRFRIFQLSKIRAKKHLRHREGHGLALACASGTVTNTTPPGLRTVQKPSKLLLAWRACKCSKLAEHAISVCNGAHARIQLCSGVQTCVRNRRHPRIRGQGVRRLRPCRLQYLRITASGAGLIPAVALGDEHAKTVLVGS